MLLGRRIPKLTLVTGKGGVGKTCVVSAMALSAARAGRRPMIVELGHRASVEALFGTTVGFEPAEIAAGLTACNLETEPTLRSYVRRYVPFEQLADRILEQPALRRLFHAAPGVTEIAAMARIDALLKMGFDPVVVDLDATGHALMLLELSEVFSELGARGPVRRMLKRARALLEADDTELYLVTLPGTLPVQETTELYEALRQRIRLGAVIVNRVPEPPWHGSTAIVETIEARAEDRGERALLEDCALLRRALHRHRDSRASLMQLSRSVPLPQIRLPELPTVERVTHLDALAAGAAMPWEAEAIA